MLYRGANRLWLVALFALLYSSALASLFNSSNPFKGTPDQIALIKQVAQDKWQQVAEAQLPKTTTASNFTKGSTPFSRRNATASDVSQARSVVADAISQMRISNKARQQSPRRNNWSMSPGSGLSGRATNSADDVPLVNITSKIAAAAALLAEIDAANSTMVTNAASLSAKSYAALEKAKSTRQSTFGTAGDTQPEKRQSTSTSYWMESLDNLGTQPFGGDSSYKVFRNVMDYGAKGDGVTDDTAAINLAISDGDRCGANCESSSVKGAVVYFPPGTYLVSSPIISMYDTQMIGSPLNLPTIKAAASFVGLGVISTDVYVPNGGTGPDGLAAEWYINTSNFYRQIRNFVIDITATDQEGYVAALHYQVAQATSIFNVAIVCTVSDTTTQQGIYAENGSGGFMSDVSFVGGAFGIYGGTQQFTSLNLDFIEIQTAVQLIWDWGFTWSNLIVADCTTGFSLLGNDLVTHATGSLFIQDTLFLSTDTAILTFPPVEGVDTGTTSITLDNVVFDAVASPIIDTDKNLILSNAIGSVNMFTVGNVDFQPTQDDFEPGDIFVTQRSDVLTTSAGIFPKPVYFTRNKNQYEDTPAVVQMKWFAAGDGVTDDTTIFQVVISLFASSDIVIFIDAGSYILTDSITIPSEARIVGQAWSQLVASGPKFEDASNPNVLLHIGADGGEVGNVELQDLIFTSVGATAGLIGVQWNMEADGQGTTAMWDCHYRIGGATGTSLQVSQCPAGSINDDCIAATLLLHLTSTSSAYLENVWAWVADHDLDDPANTQISVFSARGILIESTFGAWLYGTAAEHSALYQYNFYQAENVYAGMIQTETPYYQPSPKPPSPFLASSESMPSDPDYSVCSSNNNTGIAGCDSSWALRIVESSSIEIGGAGLYSWFSNYVQEPCVDSMDCQLAQVYIENTLGNVTIYNLITIGSVDMIIDSSTQGGITISAADNLFLPAHPYWSQIAVYAPEVDLDDGTSEYGDEVYVPPSIWTESGGASAACSAPCTLILPPYPLGSTTTINWPPLTTTLMSIAGTITQTITTIISIPAVITTEIEWWPVVIGQTDSSSASFSPVQSVMPGPVVVTFPAGVVAFPPSPYPDVGVASTSTSSTAAILLGAIPTTPHPATIQPQATVSMSTPPPTDIPSVTWTNAKPTTTCKTGCGRYDCRKFGCGDYCGLYGCNGGCGIFGCGGGCGILGCGGFKCPLGLCDGGCPLPTCGGLNCLTGDCGATGCPSGDCSKCPPEGCDGVESDDDDDCDELQTASICTVMISEYVPAGTTTISTTTITYCEPTEACSPTPTTVTTTVTTSMEASMEEISLFAYANPTADPAVVSSVAADIASMINAWDATRWGTMASSPTSTAGGNSGGGAGSGASPTPSVDVYIGLYVAIDGEIGDTDAASWRVYTPALGQLYDPCSDAVQVFEASTDLAENSSDAEAALPDGEFDMDFSIGGVASGCYYSGPDGTMGLLVCPGLGQLPCDYDPSYNQVTPCANDDQEYVMAKVFCSWADEGPIPRS
ncbi:pectate lyase superfamily protein-domain-containing protein [Xylariales sp. PMI_506]|nr:pectate lyase superfamily protein-domain-containing protein [Xylariales sp. PMI_506]